MVARIFRPARNAMQAGQAGTKSWVLEYEPEVPREIEPLMGYTSSSDMRQQVRMRFATMQDAVDYAERNGIAYRIREPNEPRRRRTSYSDNFRFDRRQAWTH